MTSKDKKETESLQKEEEMTNNMTTSEEQEEECDETEEIASTPQIQYVIVLDFEATCQKKGNPKPQEIIEFPSLLVNVEMGQVESTFHHYIRPDVHPTLLEFCTELTGIRQSQVDKGISLARKCYTCGLHPTLKSTNKYKV